MNKQRLQELFWKYIDQELDAAGEQEFLRLMAMPEAQEEAEKLGTALWEQRYQQQHFPPDERSRQRIQNILNKVQPKKVRILRYWPAAAACAVLLAGSFTWQYAARNTAAKTMYTFAAGPGERKVITLPDHSVVHLNAGSTLSYNGAYNRHDREITLNGEAFFEVAEDPQKPFKVHHEELFTEVLGTSFNVSAFGNDEDIRVTVATGKVRVSGDGNISSTLTAGQALVFDRQQHTASVTQPTHAPRAYAWKEGMLEFDSETLGHISHELERWYNVHIHIEGKELANCRFTGSFNGLPVEKVLDLLGRNASFNYSITGKEVYISGPGCP